MAQLGLYRESRQKKKYNNSITHTLIYGAGSAALRTSFITPLADAIFGNLFWVEIKEGSCWWFLGEHAVHI